MHFGHLEDFDVVGSGVRGQKCSKYALCISLKSVSLHVSDFMQFVICLYPEISLMTISGSLNSLYQAFMGDSSRVIIKSF